MTINVLAQISPPRVPLPPTFPDGVHEELSNCTAVVAPEVLGEHYDEGIRNAAIPR